MQVFVRGDRTMIAAPVQCDVDGIPKGSHVRKRTAASDPVLRRRSEYLRRVLESDPFLMVAVRKARLTGLRALVKEPPILPMPREVNASPRSGCPWSQRYREREGVPVPISLSIRFVRRAARGTAWPP